MASWRGILAGLFLASLLTAVGTAQITPPYEWKMMETEHFRIIFHPEVEGLAYEAAEAAEEAYQLWARELNTTPPPKTDIVVIDFDDSPNGFADIFNLHSWEFASQTQFSVFFGGRVPSNMADTVYHEYWHIVDIDQTSGPSQLLRKLFGRIILPNDIKPQFDVEGSATYAEYLKYGYSRANFALSAMYLRQMALDNKFPALDRAATSFTNMGWPTLGTLWYLLGSWFMRYLEEEYGRGLMAKLNELNAQNWLATLSNLLADLMADRYGIALYIGPDFGQIMSQATGVPLAELYEGFQQWLKTQALEHLKRVESEGITTSVKLTSLGYFTSQPKWSPDGSWIAYEHSSPLRLGGIRLIRPDGTDEHSLVDATLIFDGAFSWSADAKKLIYSSYDQFGPYFNFNDLYLYDLDTRQTRRLTWGARAYNPVFTPDGKGILFGQQGPGDRTQLAQLDLAKGTIQTVKEFPADTFLDFFALSPDGQQLALSLWKRPGFSDLYIMPAAGGELRALTQDRPEDFRPSWSPDGQYILFDSIRDETFNVYAVRLSDRKFFRVTNVVSGAFSPSVSPDGKKIAFSGYGSEGYDIYLMDYDPTRWKPVVFTPETIPAPPGFPKLNYPIKPYNPLVTMLPKYWQPLLRETQAGARTSAWDALYRHYYEIEAGYDWQAGRPFGSLSYINEEHLAPVRLTLSAGLVPGGNWQGLSLEYSPIEQLFLSHTLSLSLERSMFAGPQYALSGGWEYVQRFGRDLYWNDLRASLSGSLSYDVASHTWNREAVLDVRDYAHLPVIDLKGPHQVATRLALGLSDVAENFSLGGTRGAFMIRGQPRGILRGSQILTGGLEYRFPLLAIERGLGLRPLFLDDLRGAIFIEAGVAGERILELAALPSGLKIGYGAELQVLFTTGFTGRRAIRLGVAYGIGQKEPVFYFGFGSSF